MSARGMVRATKDVMNKEDGSDTPTRQAAGHLERSSKELRRPLLILTMLPYILFDNLPSHTVSDSSGEISVLPQLPTSQPFLDSRELTKQLPSAYAFQCPNHLPNRIFWIKRYQYMNVVLSHFHLLDLKFILIANFAKKLICSMPKFCILKYCLASFRTPYQVVCRVVDHMTRPLECHTYVISHYARAFADKGAFPSPL